MGANVPRDSSLERRNRHGPHLSTEIKEALALPLIKVPERGYMGRPLPPNRPTTAARFASTSSASDGYSKAGATFSANNVDADWNKEAVEAAKNYLDTMPMSKDALIQQLSSSAGDK